jgi:hypothetical protein
MPSLHARTSTMLSRRARNRNIGVQDPENLSIDVLFVCSDGFVTNATLQLHICSSYCS